MEKTRTALRDEYLLQLDAAAKSALADGRETDAERFWQRYLQEEPLCETVSVSLMELYRARRDYNRAALVYRSLHKAMSDWLGITPLKETSALYYSIMEEWNARADPEDQRSDDFLVGRQEQLQSLFQLFPGPGSGRRRQSFVLLGEAGVGKSHLLAHFLAHGAVSDAQIVTTSCFKSKQEEYLYPWQAVMLSIASYIRKEDIPIPTAYRQAVSALFPVFGSGEGSVEKKAHMLIDSVMSFDSVLMILSLAAEKRPLLLVLEDIQWMDKISADLLDQLLHKADSSRILFAATCRQPSGPVATPLLRGLEEDGLCRCCHLSPFTKDETMEFIQLYGAQSLPQADKERIYQDTQGNAFLLTQLIGSIMENGRPTVLPRNMEEILSYRLSGLTDEGLQVLNLVAMFPDRAPYPVLERVSSKPTLDLLYVCQELCRRSILTEVYDGGALSLAFAQAEFRELTYSRIPALSRRILHLNIAQALADLSPASVPDLDALTAYHYDQGGDQFHAMQYKVHRFKTYVVFNYALLNGMPREGEVLLRSLMLLRDGVTDDVELRLQSAYAHDYIGEAYRKQGSYEKAIGEYQMAIQTIGTFPTSTSKPMFYVNWAQAALAQADYAAARQALAQADRATGYLKEPSGYFQTLFCVYSALKGKAGVFELELLHRLDLGSADPLPGLLQVTEN
ncbi:AAA family ATPase [Lawsonibacter sp. LCP25S3_F5]